MLISAIVPHLGEATLERALQALKAQTHPLQEIHQVEGVRPFSRAFNQGVGMVRTPFFLQCDADMILYPEAVERLAQGMADDVCMVVGWLQDPLQGPIQGIKLHRTEVARQNPHQEECSCETAYLERVFRQGWRLELYSPSDCLGEHLPSQDETYTFARFLYLGRKIRLRRDSSDVRMRLARLADRWELEVAPTAAAALCAGLCLDPDGDGPGTSPHGARWLQSNARGRVREWLKSRDWDALLAGCGEMLLGDLEAETLRSRQCDVLAALARQEHVRGWAHQWTPAQ